MNPIKILILTANPQIPDYDPLRLDAEVRRVEEALQRSRYRDRFEIATKLAVRTTDLRRALLDHRPQIVHFSGHGTGEQGLVLENDAGKAQLVSTEALAGLFGIFETGQIECVLLNACYSEVQAMAIHQFVDCVIGMNQPIGDKPAVQFAEGFYDALGAGSDYDEAFEIGCSAIALEGSSEHSTPVKKYRKRRRAPLSAEPAAEPTSVPATEAPSPATQSQSFGNINISGSNNAFSGIQAGENSTVSQDNSRYENNSRQSMNISGGTIYGSVGQAGGNLTQTQSQNENAKPLTPQEVVKLFAEIETLLEGSGLPEGQKNKAIGCLESAKEEVSEEEPDKTFAAKNLRKVTKILKETDDAVGVGQSLLEKVTPVVKKLLPWLGVASHFFGL